MKKFFVFLSLLFAINGWAGVYYSAKITRTGLYRFNLSGDFKVHYDLKEIPFVGTLVHYYFLNWERDEFTSDREVILTPEVSSLPAGTLRPLSSGKTVYTFMRKVNFQREFYMFAYRMEGSRIPHWYWGYFAQRGSFLPPTGSLPFSLPNLACDGSVDVNIAIDGFATYEPSPFEIGIDVNGSSFYSDPITDYRYHSLEFSVPCDVLKEKDNELKLLNTTGSGVFALDRIEISYPSYFTPVAGRMKFSLAEDSCININDVTGPFFLLRIDDPYNPEMVETATAKSSVLSVCLPAGSYFFQLESSVEIIDPVRKFAPDVNFLPEPDLLIITAPEFANSPSLDRLIKRRIKEGLNVLVVPTDQIYYWFSNGNKDPGAIIKFLAAMRSIWVDFPKYLMIVGLSTSAPRNDIETPPGYLKYMEGKWDFVPTAVYTSRIENTGIMFPYYDVGSDFYYADPDDDGTIDYYVGRLPVTTETEISNVVDKIFSYEQSVPSRVVIVNDRDANGFDFSVFASQIADMIPDEFPRERIDLTKLTVSDANKDLIDEFSLGGRLLTYTGHGFFTFWSAIYDEPPYYILSVDYNQGRFDPALMKYPESPFIVFQLTCFANSIYWHMIPGSLGRVLVSAKTGASASIGGSDYSDYAAQKIFARYIVPQFFTSNNKRLGQAYYRGLQLYMFEHPEGKEMAYTYPLLGDPTMQLWGETENNTEEPTEVSMETTPMLISEESGGGEGCSSVGGTFFFFTFLFPGLLWMLVYLRRL